MQTFYLKKENIFGDKIESTNTHIFLLNKMSLPSRVLLLISEYSKPMTRPDWRQSKPLINPYRLFLHGDKPQRNKKGKYVFRAYRYRLFMRFFDNMKNV